jgi:hypothetical protein
MSNTTNIHVTLPTDENGMVGRECPNCKKYFKVKPGTGLKTSECICPYCEHKDGSLSFSTADQIEYAKSIAVKQIVGPILNDFQRSIKSLGRSSSKSFISFKVETRGFDFPIKYYSEKDLETTVLCDACGLVFAIYGIFASCPDCSRLNSMSIFRKSLEASRKRLHVISKLQPEETELQEVILMDALAAGVSSFDSLGKRLAKEFPSNIPEKPRNLFQNLDALDDVLSKTLSIKLTDLITEDEYEKVYYLFQVRHISSHNFGEIDNDFVKKVKCDPKLIGSKPIVVQKDLVEFLDAIEKLGAALRNKL